MNSRIHRSGPYLHTHCPHPHIISYLHYLSTLKLSSHHQKAKINMMLAQRKKSSWEGAG